MLNRAFGSRKKPPRMRSDPRPLTLSDPIIAWRNTARERPEEILKQPLDSLLILSFEFEVFDLLPPWALLRLPPEVLVRVSRISPKVFAKVSAQDVAHLSEKAVQQLPLEVLAALQPDVLLVTPPLKLAAALNEEPEIAKVLSKDLLEEVFDVGCRAGVLNQADIAALRMPPATQSSAPAEPSDMGRPGSKVVSLHPDDGPSVTADVSASPAVGGEPRADAETSQEPIEVEKDAQLGSLMRQYNDLLQECIDLKSKRAVSWERMRAFLHEHGWLDGDWETDSDTLDGIFKFAEKHADLAAREHERAEHLVLEYAKEKTQRMMLEEQVQALNEKLEEQGCREASQGPSEQHEAGIKRLQQLVGSQKNKYQAIIKGLEDQHSTTVRRLIDEHTAEMSDQMTAYEKELAETRMAHGEELAKQKQRHWEELDNLKDRIAVLECRLASASHDPQSTPENSSHQTANSLPR